MATSTPSSALRSRMSDPKRCAANVQVAHHGWVIAHLHRRYRPDAEKPSSLNVRQVSTTAVHRYRLAMADSDSFDGRVPLLGQLAGEGWFMGMGEVAATKSLTWLASDPRLRAALLAHLGTRAGINLSSVERLVPESVHDDRSRPDIEMLDADGHTVAVVEAKFGAHLTDGQVSAYLEVLSRRPVLTPARCSCSFHQAGWSRRSVYSNGRPPLGPTRHQRTLSSPGMSGSRCGLLSRRRPAMPHSPATSAS